MTDTASRADLSAAENKLNQDTTTSGKKKKISRRQKGLLRREGAHAHPFVDQLS